MNTRKVINENIPVNMNLSISRDDIFTSSLDVSAFCLYFFSSERDARTLFVKNLPYSITQDELKEVFDQAIEVRIPMDNNGSSRG